MSKNCPVSDNKKEITVSMITGLNNLSKFIKFKNAGGMGTQVPLLKSFLEKKGINVLVDEFKGMDVFHIHTPLVEGIFSGLKGRIKNIPVVIHARHLPELVVDSFMGGRAIDYAARAQARYFYNLADAIICGTEYTKMRLKELGIKKKMFVIPNGVNREKIKYSSERRSVIRKKLGLDDSDFLIMSVGLAIKRKGIYDFYEIAANYCSNNKDSQINGKKIKFLWIGGTEFGMSEFKMKKPSNLFHIDYVPFEEICSYYSAADAFIFPTYAESYGNVLFEAASAGLPIISRDIKIYEHILTNGDNCLKAVNNEEFINSISLLATNEGVYSKLKAGSEKLARDNDLNLSIEKIMNIYFNLIEDRVKT